MAQRRTLAQTEQRNSILDPLLQRIRQELAASKAAGDHFEPIVNGANLRLLERLVPHIPAGVTINDFVAGWKFLSEYRENPSGQKYKNPEYIHERRMVCRELSRLASVPPARNLDGAHKIWDTWAGCIINQSWEDDLRVMFLRELGEISGTGL